MRPTIGRIVHYTMCPLRHAGALSPEKEPPRAFAAIITDVRPSGVSLQVFVPSAYVDPGHRYDDVQFTEEKPGTNAACGMWSWPPHE